MKSVQTRSVCTSTRDTILRAIAAFTAISPLVGAATVEPIDLNAYSAIREEGLNHSHAFEFAAQLADEIGPRLTGSPNLTKANEWAEATLAQVGASGVHLEDFGEFGISWQQRNTWMRMSSPDTMVFIAQAAPWSVSTPGVVEAEAVEADIANDADLAKYRGRLAGKIVFLGENPPSRIPFTPLARRFTDAELRNGDAVADIAHYYQIRPQRLIHRSEESAFHDRLRKFLQAEGVVAVVTPSQSSAEGSGAGNLTVATVSAQGSEPWLAAKRPTFPIAITASENYGRVTRLLSHSIPVKIELNIDARDTDLHGHGYNVVADFPGVDAKLRRQIVLVTAHLDSWAGGTGATDDGAGVAISLEAVRILNQLNLKMRRTVRVVFNGGEEQGLLGALAYAEQHFGVLPRSEDPVQLRIFRAWRASRGPVQKGPDYANFCADYDMDAGGGRVRGVHTGGNPALAEIYRQWITPMSDLGVESVFDSPDWPADQSVYTDIGLPGIAFLQDPLDYDTQSRHTNMDTVERLSASDMAQAATVEAIFIFNTANRDDLLPRAAMK